MQLLNSLFIPYFEILAWDRQRWNPLRTPSGITVGNCEAYAQGAVIFARIMELQAFHIQI